MPKYYDYAISGYYLYFTAACTVECIHAHASDKSLTRKGSAKFFIKDNGDAVVQKKGDLKDKDIKKIQKFIKSHYEEMYSLWSEYSDNGFYRGKSEESVEINKMNLF